MRRHGGTWNAPRWLVFGAAAVGMVAAVWAGDLQGWPAVLAALGVVLPAAALLADRRHAAVANDLDLEIIADRLAELVRHQWSAEANSRDLNRPPLAVSWRPADPSLSEPWANLQRMATVSGGWSSPEHLASGPRELAGTGHDFAAIFGLVPTGRLVVLGEPGSGKTILLVGLVLDLLARRSPGSPVPLLLPLASFNPEDQDLRGWLEAQIIREYPWLAASTSAGASRARHLLNAGLLLPVLDGLDEVAPDLRGEALRTIGWGLSPGEQVVLTCRTTEYAAAVRPGVGRPAVLAGAAVVELRPLNAEDIARYLVDATASDTWEVVLAQLRRDPDGPLATALRTPLMVNLFRIAYGEGVSAPSELLDPVRFGTRTAIERHLLNTAAAAAFLAPSRPFEPSRWSADGMRRWLGFVARLLEQEGTPDIAWWRLDRAVPRLVLIAVGLVISVVGGSAAGFAFDSVAGGWVVPAAASSTGIALASMFTWASRSAAGPRAMRIRRRHAWGRFAFWMALSMSAGALSGYLLEDGDWGGIAVWLAAGATAGLVAALRETVGGLMDTQRAAGPVQVLAQDRANTLLHATATGLTAILVVAVAGGLVRNPVAAAVFGLTCALARASSTAYYRYRVSHGWLAIRGLLPWSLLSLLEEARDREVLRIVGAVYQFRHASLQERLASERDGGPIVGQPTDRAAEEAISALKDSLVERAFERADVRAVVDAQRIAVLKREIRAEIESNRTRIAGATAAGRERFVAAKTRYVERVGVPALSRAARVYALSATTALAFVSAGLVASADHAGDTIMFLGFAGGLTGTALCLLTLRWLLILADARRNRAAAMAARRESEGEPGESGDPDHRRAEDRPDGRAEAHSGEEGTSSDQSSVISIMRWIAASRAVWFAIIGCAAAVPGVLAVGLLQSWNRDLFVPPVDQTPVPFTAVGAVLLGFLWLWARPWRARHVALRSEDPAIWPTEDDVRRAASARQDALRAHKEWINALLENGVLALVSAKVEVIAKRSYETFLPEASVSKLGDITESAQFVPTETSAELGRMLAAMANGAIGLSGPRGIGKSTVLRVFGDRRFGASPDDLTLVVPAPTNYDSRDFLVHLFTRLCELLLPGDPEARTITPMGRTSRVRLRWSALAAFGVLLVAGGLTWPVLVRVGSWLQAHPRTVVVTVGTGLTCAAIARLARALPIGRSTRSTDNPAEDRARYYLRTLRYQETTTSARSGMLKASALEVGSSTSRDLAEQLRTYPELVNDFRKFLDFLALRLRSRANGPAGRIIICIDELDKIATAEQAEQFINDIKTVFGVEGCFFLVAVSEDALLSFARRALAVRTTFDSAFDNVIQVRRFNIADTRRLLVQRVLRLPEPFVWLCHSLSGGLPRDINRTVRLMYDIRLVHRTDTFERIAAELILRDIETVTQGQILRVSGRVEAESGAVLRWLATARQLPLDAARLLTHSREAPSAAAASPDHDESNLFELRLLVEQFRIYLYYAAVLVRCFCEQSEMLIEMIQRVDDDTTSPVQQLADARISLSVEPTLSQAALDTFQTHLRSAGIPAMDWSSDG